jgi:hypothetical protein
MCFPGISSHTGQWQSFLKMHFQFIMCFPGISSHTGLWQSFLEYSTYVKIIAGHRHRGRCRRHRHSGILCLRPLPEHSRIGLGTLIPVPDWFRHRHFCSFRYRTDWMPDSPTFRHLKKGYTLHVYTAGGRKGHTLNVHRQLLMVLFLLNDNEKSYVNAGMSECRNAGEKLVRHRHFFW